MRLHGVGRRYGLSGPWVLRGVDLDVAPGALLRIEGANGSGKSTLLRLLAGIDAPSAGRITGRPRTAYVPERFPADLPFTALGYLTHLGRIHGLGRSAAGRSAAAWLDRFGAADHSGTRLSELSKGTSQKVAVASALLAEPGLLILDEAWTGLDQAARRVLDEAVAERVAGGGTVVFVDHDPRRLAGAEDAVHRLTEGRLRPVPRPSAAGQGAPDGPQMVVEAEGPPGAEPPDGLPGAPVRLPAPAGPRLAAAPSGDSLVWGAGHPNAPAADPGPPPPVVVRFAVGAAHSDALLRALLAARPPWHIRGVAPRPADVPPTPAPLPGARRADAPDGRSPGTDGAPATGAEGAPTGAPGPSPGARDPISTPRSGDA